MSPQRILHLTSVHRRYDTRIFDKMCRGLVNNGFTCALVVADGLGDETRDGVKIIDAGASAGRWSRMTKAPRRVADVAAREGADIFHLHDPELLTVASDLRQYGKVIVFDAHEDLPVQVLEKPYIPHFARRPLSRLTSIAERLLVRHVDAVIGATPWISDKFANYGCKSIWIANFADSSPHDSMLTYLERPIRASYVGALSQRRGIVQVVQALAKCRSPISLGLAGVFQEPNLRAQVEAMPGWDRVEYLGYISRHAVFEELDRSRVGLVTIHPTAIDVEGLPVKLFEYMAAGIPVVASNIPHWIDIVEGNGCGICVDPAAPDEIADALDWIMRNPSEAAEMGERGRQAVDDRYHWRTEMQKLLALYEALAKLNEAGPVPGP